MTVQEAIEYLEQHGYTADDVKDMCIKALEKQISKKPKVHSRMYLCPSCGCGLQATDDFILFEVKYCEHCGQKLDWGE